MGYPLAIVRIKKSLVHALPLHVSENQSINPLAGPFEGFLRARLCFAVGKFPYAEKLEGVRDTFEIEAPGGGRLEIWITPDGHIFMDSQAGLELVLSLFIELRTICPEIAIEDPQRGILHDVESFKDFLCGEETAEKPLKDYVDEEVA